MIQPITKMEGAFCLKGKNVIVTGGNRGLGLGIAEAMAQVGANIAIFCRDAAKAAEALEILKPYGTTCKSYSCDVVDMQSVRDAVAAAYADFGNIDILHQVPSGHGRGPHRLVQSYQYRPERLRSHDLRGR